MTMMNNAKEKNMQDNNVIFGIDIGGTTVKCGFFNGNGKLISKEEIKTDKSDNGEHILEDIAKYIEDVLNKNELTPQNLIGVGIGVPGSVRADGVVNKCVNLGWGVFNVSAKMSDLLGISQDYIYVGNDANVAALGEFWKGSGEEYNSAMMVTIGTGVGGGLILDGNLINGYNGAAAEIGHMPIADEIDYPCSCGKKGCLEQVASATGIARLAGTDNAKVVFDRAKAGDKEMEEVIEKVSKYLGKALACVSAVVDPECFIIGGGVSAAGSYFIDKIQKYYREFAFHASKETKIVQALLGNDAGIFGAARLCMDVSEEKDLLSELREIVGSEDVKLNEKMSQHTTLRIGGPADYFVTPEDENQIKELIELLNEKNVDYYVCGNGSNLLVSDEGYRGVIIQIYNKYSGYEILSDLDEKNTENVYLKIKSGTNLIKMANICEGMGLAGMEFASGIPGTIGGAVCMNAGAYGKEMKDILESAEVIDKDGNIKTLSNEELKLTYRDSKVAQEGLIVLSAVIKLEKGVQEEIKKKKLEYAAARRDKQPLEYPSAGSTFKRPLNNFAGKLIEDAGLKGYRVGDAEVSEKHAGFVINKGNASASDFTILTENVIKKVETLYGIRLELEVKKLGF